MTMPVLVQVSEREKRRTKSSSAGKRARQSKPKSPKKAPRRAGHQKNAGTARRKGEGSVHSGIREDDVQCHGRKSHADQARRVKSVMGTTVNAAPSPIAHTA
jgi:hypothetical protein